MFECGIALLWGEERFLGTSLHFQVCLVLGRSLQKNPERAQVQRLREGRRMLGSHCFRQWLQAPFQGASPKGGQHGLHGRNEGAAAGRTGRRGVGTSEEHRWRGSRKARKG